MSPDALAIDVRNLREFFRDAVQEALARRKVGIEDHTEHYVVNLLAMCARTEALFDATAGGPRLKPLALMLVDAASAPDGEQRSRALQRLGDVSLFVSGFLSHGFARRLVDVGYHIAMGGRAYGALAGSGGPRRWSRNSGGSTGSAVTAGCAARSCGADWPRRGGYSPSFFVATFLRSSIHFESSRRSFFFFQLCLPSEPLL